MEIVTRSYSFYTIWINCGSYFRNFWNGRDLFLKLIKRISKSCCIFYIYLFIFENTGKFAETLVILIISMRLIKNIYAMSVKKCQYLRKTLYCYQMNIWVLLYGYVVMSGYVDKLDSNIMPVLFSCEILPMKHKYWFHIVFRLDIFQ